MSTTEEQIAQQAPAPETPAIETPAAPAVPETRHEVISRALETQITERGKHAVHQPRDNGRFAGPPQFPAPAAVAPVAPVRPEMPATFKKELKAHWDALPVEFATAVHQRELDSRKGVELLQTKAQQADELLNEFKPYEMLLRMENSTPKQAVASLLQTSAILRTGTPLQKAQAVSQVMQQFGIPIEHIQQMLGQPNTGSQPAMNPQFNALAQQVNELKQNWTHSQQLQQQQSEARSLAAIQTFAADPEHVHFEAVQDRMLSLLQSPQVLGIDTSGMSDQEKLKTAYDAAIRLDPALSAQALAAQQVAQQTAQQVTKSRAAAVQVKGAPASGPAAAANPKDRHAFISNLMDRA